MSYEYSEDGLVEAATEEILQKLGWTVTTAWHKESFATNNDRNTGLLGRIDKTEVVLERYLLQALQTLNPDLPAAAYHQAIQEITRKTADKSLAAINKEKYDSLKNGVKVSFKDANGQDQDKKLQVFNFKEPEKNHFLAVRQLEISGHLYERRPDVIGFVNGIPLVFIELKQHGVELRHAYDDNFTDYKDTIPKLFYCNAFVILSNGTDAKVGTITSPYKFFHDWKRIAEDDEGMVSLDTLLQGTCDKTRLMDLFENFLLFDGEGDTVTKLMAKNHQYLGVNKVVEKSRNLADLERKLGVFWHTQGSGKSYSMVFLCQKILRKIGGGITFLIVVDRSELESQIYDTFTGVGVVTEKHVKASSREHLRQLLQENHRYLFTLIHKFSFDPKKEREYPLLTERQNIIVISDEAHRTQGGIFAQNMRYQALPNAAFLGFTGTPLIDDEVEITKNIFGEYVSIYDFQQAIADGATLPLRYLNRGEKLAIENPNLDEKMAEIINGEELDENQRHKLERLFETQYPILTAEKRLRAIAKDLVWHFNERGYQGKAMFVALDKPTAIRMYDYVMEYWQEYLAEFQTKISKAEDEQQQLELQQRFKRVQETEVCVVVSSEQNEVQKFKNLGLEIERHREKMVKRNLEKEFKDENNPFRLVIVCAMWITGFDVPCVSTVYLDKPIGGHTLVQTIARANRVYDDEKENGLVVDYGNVYEQLKKAYLVYGNASDKRKNDTDNDPDKKLKLSGLVNDLKQAIVEVRSVLAKLEFNLGDLINVPNPLNRLAKLKEATNAVCLNETSRTEFEAAANNVFRKYKAVYPEPEIEAFFSEYNAIEAIYKRLNQKTVKADISAVIKKLQEEVNISITVADGGEVGAEIEISQIDFEKLKQAFSKSKQKNQVVFDLQKAVEAKLNKMLQQNPLRLEFYTEYQKIIAEYNNGKDVHAVEKAFNDLKDFVPRMSEEEQRAAAEGLDEETLAIFDLLKKDNLTLEEREQVKKVAKDTLKKLKEEVFRFNFWRQSPQHTNNAIRIIHADVKHLPVKPYPNEELPEKENLIYQHISGRYWGGDSSLYN
jgi:type I restriction enzyme, R subunit